MGKPEHRRLGDRCGAWSRKGIKQRKVLGRKVLGIGLERERGGSCNLGRGIVRTGKARSSERSSERVERDKVWKWRKASEGESREMELWSGG